MRIKFGGDGSSGDGDVEERGGGKGESAQGGGTSIVPRLDEDHLRKVRLDEDHLRKVLEQVCGTLFGQ